MVTKQNLKIGVGSYPSMDHTSHRTGFTCV